MLTSARPAISCWYPRCSGAARTSRHRLMSSASPNFSAGSDVAALTSSLEPLISRPGGKWTLARGGEALERSFKFKTFGKTWDFMTAVSLQCKLKNHHPEWSNVYNTTFIRWTTHSPKGLSEKDISLAAICDDLAKAFGELPSADDAASCSTPQSDNVLDRVVSSAGDCCAPKK
ncbi:unnamed protein product [Parascedosporium putredinis]|uniref:4a-hydroxytetrahydrobiopterin dehydratase n=1 Tax=Parascedosporium putredinis TaxID=1442378 RepID=A0A9P1GUJ7_9PEZI|nr:unnamed protein product [Parascedosporium putredinis]CAI7987645.1 unnamed protein product [Parascedosporium putredinis]